MHQADQLLAQGDLAGARAALVEHVRSEPGDAKARMFLFQLLAIAGEWDKALKALDLIAQLSPEAQMMAVAYSQAIAGERLREEVFAGTARAHVFGEERWAEGVADALQQQCRGDAAAADDTRAEAFDAAPDTPGRFNETAVDWLADSDPRFGPTLEIIIAGRYGLIPFVAVDRIESEGPKDLRDLVWYPVEVAMKSGQSIAAFVPTRYPATIRHGDTAEMLARATSWGESAAGGEEGRGQRLLSLSDGSEAGLLELRTLVID